MKWPKILKQPLSRTEIKELAEEFFGDMIKIVADVEQGLLAVGGSLHADAEELLLKRGSEQHNIWGANYFPGRKKGVRVEYTALINLRPRQGNRSQLIGSPAIRRKFEGIMKGYFEI